MKNVIKPLIKFGIDKAKRNRFIQNLFEAPFELDKFEKNGSFTDSSGNQFELLKGLRTKIKPGWENMLKVSSLNISEEYLSTLKNNGNISTNKIQPILKAVGKDIKGSSVMEIGCHAGATVFSFADLGAAEVTGTEFSGYKVEAIDEFNRDENKLVEVNQELKLIRNKLEPKYKNGKKVIFLDDDICNTTLKADSFDIICSWDVLEHLHDTKNAFVSIAKLLKEDGVTIHEYNPFFSLNGGHSLCTLDFLWGHTRLAENDVSRYLEELRPDEKDRALSFYRKGLNRMTILDLTEQIKMAGLEIIAILPYTKEQHLRMVDNQILKQSQRNYPNSNLIDLVSPRVVVIAKKNPN